MENYINMLKKEGLLGDNIPEEYRRAWKGACSKTFSHRVDVEGVKK